MPGYRYKLKLTNWCTHSLPLLQTHQFFPNGQKYLVKVNCHSDNFREFTKLFI